MADYPLRARSHPACKNKAKVASKTQRELAKLLLEKDGCESIRDEAAIIAPELKRESKDKMSSLNNLLIEMGCAQHTDGEITIVLGILS